ncbi:MAG: hypothetical protein SGCHY_004837, partial [Lobulomycetales sp.]
LSLVLGVKVVGSVVSARTSLLGESWPVYVAGGSSIMNAAALAILLVAIARPDVRLAALMLDMVVFLCATYLAYMVAFGIAHSILLPGVPDRGWIHVLVIALVNTVLLTPLSFCLRRMGQLEMFEYDDSRDMEEASSSSSSSSTDSRETLVVTQHSPLD